MLGAVTRRPAARLDSGGSVRLRRGRFRVGCVKDDLELVEGAQSPCPRACSCGVAPRSASVRSRMGGYGRRDDPTRSGRIVGLTRLAAIGGPLQARRRLAARNCCHSSLAGVSRASAQTTACRRTRDALDPGMSTPVLDGVRTPGGSAGSSTCSDTAGISGGWCERGRRSTAGPAAATLSRYTTPTISRGPGIVSVTSIVLV
jgi:hypothetical protein